MSSRKKKRLRFEETGASSAGTSDRKAYSASGTSPAEDKSSSKSKLRREREGAANTLRSNRKSESSSENASNQSKRKRKQGQADTAKKNTGTAGKSAQAAENQESAASKKLKFGESDVPKPKNAMRNLTYVTVETVNGISRTVVSHNDKDNNAGVQSAEFIADSVSDSARTVEQSLYSHKLKQYASAQKLTTKTDKENLAELYKEAIKKHPEAASNPISRWRQRQQIKKQYVAMKAGQKAASSVAGQASEKGIKAVGNRLLAYAKSNSYYLILIGFFALLLLTISSAVTSCTAISSGIGNTVLGTSFTANTEDILGVEEDYCAMEDALRIQLRQLQSGGNYDEYRVSADEIGHNPWELIALLTVLKEDFKREEVQPLLRQIFEAQYKLTTRVTSETVTETHSVRVGESLGFVTTSGYCSCRICCGQWSGGPTASGRYPTANHTIAVDASNPFLPMGTKVIMNGIEYTVEDTGNFARYGVQFDVYYDNHSAALMHGHRTWECFLADSNGSNTVQVTNTYNKKILNITLKNNGIRAVMEGMHLSRDQRERFDILLETRGNRSELFADNIYATSTGDYLHYSVPGEALTDERFRKMIKEAEKYLGYPYVWGGSSPSTGFDCSGFVSWVINNCGNGWSVGRQTAESLRSGHVDIIPKSEAKPGDLIFFKGTYNTSGASHVGIYVGNGMMIHCGNPISYASIDTAYWQEHFYCFGRIR